MNTKKILNITVQP